MHAFARTTAISLPALFRNAFVHFTLRGLRFLMKALWHLGRQNRKVCASEGRQPHVYRHYGMTLTNDACQRNNRHSTAPMCDAKGVTTGRTQAQAQPFTSHH